MSTETLIAAPVHEQSTVEIDKAFLEAREAQRRWRRFTLTQRVDAIRGLWSFLLEEREALARVIHEETGKPQAEIQGMEIEGSELILKYFTRNAHRILQETAAPRPWLLLNKRAYVRHKARGVIGLITPWNMPFLIPFGDMIPALLAGNAVVIKPSEWTSKIVQYFVERIRACGLFPQGLVQVVTGAGAAGGAVTERADMVVFTGSTATGKRVAQAAAKRLIPAVLELGGFHPMIVAEDAPLKRAVKAALWGRFANSGQICVGVERVFVHEAVYDVFCESLKKERAALRQTPGDGYDVDMGRLIFPGQLQVIEEHIQDAREKGAEVIGGKILDRDALLVEPTLILGATPDMAVMQSETFGPVLAVAKTPRVDEAIRQANTGTHGLAASIWTRDIVQGEEWASMLESGLVSVNDVLSHYVVCSLPFGGTKESGMGRRHSAEGLRMFTEAQSVIVHEFPADAPDLWWFPYSLRKSRLLSFLSRWT
jgi:acyl-CoA reductase-like NAD-dependent aldehyde dehydrogenase